MINNIMVLFKGPNETFWGVVVGIIATVIVGLLFYFLSSKDIKKQQAEIDEKHRTQNRFLEHISPSGDRFINDDKNIEFKETLGSTVKLTGHVEAKFIPGPNHKDQE